MKPRAIPAKPIYERTLVSGIQPVARATESLPGEEQKLGINQLLHTIDKHKIDENIFSELLYNMHAAQAERLTIPHLTAKLKEIEHDKKEIEADFDRVKQTTLAKLNVQRENQAAAFTKYISVASRFSKQKFIEWLQWAFIASATEYLYYLVDQTSEKKITPSVIKNFNEKFRGYAAFDEKEIVVKHDAFKQLKSLEELLKEQPTPSTAPMGELSAKQLEEYLDKLEKESPLSKLKNSTTEKFQALTKELKNLLAQFTDFVGESQANKILIKNLTIVQNEIADETIEKFKGTELFELKNESAIGGHRTLVMHESFVNFQDTQAAPDNVKRIYHETTDVIEEAITKIRSACEKDMDTLTRRAAALRTNIKEREKAFAQSVSHLIGSECKKWEAHQHGINALNGEAKNILTSIKDATDAKAIMVNQEKISALTERFKKIIAEREPLEKEAKNIENYLSKVSAHQKEKSDNHQKRMAELEKDFKEISALNPERRNKELTHRLQQITPEKKVLEKKVEAIENAGSIDAKTAEELRGYKTRIAALTGEYSKESERISAETEKNYALNIRLIAIKKEKEQLESEAKKFTAPVTSTEASTITALNAIKKATDTPLKEAEAALSQLEALSPHLNTITELQKQIIATQTQGPGEIKKVWDSFIGKINKADFSDLDKARDIFAQAIEEKQKIINSLREEPALVQRYEYDALLDQKNILIQQANASRAEVKILLEKQKTELIEKQQNAMRIAIALNGETDSRPNKKVIADIDQYLKASFKELSAMATAVNNDTKAIKAFRANVFATLTNPKWDLKNNETEFEKALLELKTAEKIAQTHIASSANQRAPVEKIQREINQTYDPEYKIIHQIQTTVSDPNPIPDLKILKTILDDRETRKKYTATLLARIADAPTSITAPRVQLIDPILSLLKLKKDILPKITELEKQTVDTKSTPLETEVTNYETLCRETRTALEKELKKEIKDDQEILRLELASKKITTMRAAVAARLFGIDKKFKAIFNNKDSAEIQRSIEKINRDFTSIAHDADTQDKWSAPEHKEFPTKFNPIKTFCDTTISDLRSKVSIASRESFKKISKAADANADFISTELHQVKNRNVLILQLLKAVFEEESPENIAFWRDNISGAGKLLTSKSYTLSSKTKNTFTFEIAKELIDIYEFAQDNAYKDEKECKKITAIVAEKISKILADREGERKKESEKTGKSATEIIAKAAGIFSSTSASTPKSPTASGQKESPTDKKAVAEPKDYDYFLLGVKTLISTPTTHLPRINLTQAGEGNRILKELIELGKTNYKKPSPPPSPSVAAATPTATTTTTTAATSRTKNGHRPSQ